MIAWASEMVLYHGGYCAVPTPDLKKCSPNKDFGIGFYVTTSKEQAIRFIPSALKKAKHYDLIPGDASCGVVTVYRFSPSDTLNIKEYPTADADWLHCITAHRKPAFFRELKTEAEIYDIIAGKIANDQTNATLTAYLAGLYGEIGSKEADADCIRRLLPQRLENQICLRSAKALAQLTYMGEENVWMR